MSNRILVTIQDDHQEVDTYLNYVARLSKDFNLKLELVSGVEKFINNPEPIAIVGGGLPLPVKEIKGDLNYKVHELKNRFDDLGILNNGISCEISMIPIDEKLKDLDSLEDVRLVTINQSSSDNYFNQLFGTPETKLAKSTNVLSLTVPDGIEYVKPKTVLCIIRDVASINLEELHLLSKIMNIRVLFVYHEENSEVSIQSFLKSSQAKFGEFVGSMESFSLDFTDDHLDKIFDREKPEWIAVANFDRSFLERIYKKNTNELLLTSKVPIINF